MPSGSEAGGGVAYGGRRRHACAVRAPVGGSLELPTEVPAGTRSTSEHSRENLGDTTAGHSDTTYAAKWGAVASVQVQWPWQWPCTFDVRVGIPTPMTMSQCIEIGFLYVQL